MKDTKLIKVIEKFSRADMKRLRDFIYSPFFNKSEKICALFDFIQKYAPDFGHKKFTQEHASTYVFSDKKTDIQAVIKLQSRLFKLVEQFIYQHLKNNAQPDVELALMRFYHKENLISHYNNIHQRARKIQEDYPYKDGIYYHNQYLIETQYRLFLTAKFENSKGDIHHKKVAETLDAFYFSEKLNQFCLMLNRQRLTNVEYDMVLMDEILDFLSGSIYEKIPEIAVRQQAVLLLKSTEKATYYKRLKQLLNENGNKLNKMLHRELYTYLENTSRQVFEQAEAQYMAVFELYEMQLKNGLLYIDGFLLPTVFRNIVTVGLNLEKLDWIEDFLQKNQHKISPEYDDREDVYKYCMAQLYFKQQKVDKALSIINQGVFSDIYMKMGTRLILAKVYYELNYGTMLEDLVNSFRKFLFTKKDTLPPVHIQANRDFINITYNIYKTVKRDHDRLNQLESQINNTQILPERKWLLEKLQEKR